MSIGIQDYLDAGSVKMLEYYQMIKGFFRERLEIGHHNIILEWKRLKEFGLVPCFIILLGAAVTAIVSLPAIFGVLTMIIGNGSPPSPIESIGLALLSAALAGVIFLLVKPRIGSTNGSPSEDVSKKGRSASEVMGSYFIIAAIAFALFAVLCPFLGAVSDGQRFFPLTAAGDFFELIVKWVALISLLIGTCTFVVSLVLGPFLFASDILRRKKQIPAQSN